MNDDHDVTKGNHAVGKDDHAVAKDNQTVVEANHTVVEANHTVVEADHTVVESDHTVAEDHFTVAKDGNDVAPGRFRGVRMTDAVPAIGARASPDVAASVFLGTEEMSRSFARDASAPAAAVR